jgi:hypothetical protein
MAISYALWWFVTRIDQTIWKHLQSQYFTQLSSATTWQCIFSVLFSLPILYCSNGLILRGTLGYREARKSLLLRPLCHLIQHTWRVVRRKDMILMTAAITPTNRLVRASDLITSRWLQITWPIFIDNESGCLPALGITRKWKFEEILVTKFCSDSFSALPQECTYSSRFYSLE